MMTTHIFRFNNKMLRRGVWKDPKRSDHPCP